MPSRTDQPVVTSPSGSPTPPDWPGGERRGLQRKTLVRLLRALFVLLIVAGIGYAVLREWDGVVVALRDLTWWALALSFAAVCIGVATGVEVWRSIVIALGSPVPYTSAARIILVGQLGKYLPGSVWAFLAQTELSRRADIPRARAFVAILASTGITTVTAFALAPLALGTVDRPWVRLCLMVAPVAAVVLHPRLLSGVVRIALMALRRPQPTLHVPGRAILRSVVSSLATFAMFGLHLYLLARSVADLGPAQVVLCIAAMALAMTLGVFAFLSPSGLGVREAFVVAALIPTVPLGRALGISLVSRFLFIVADVMAALVVLVGARHLLAGRPVEVDAVQAATPDAHPTDR